MEAQRGHPGTESEQALGDTRAAQREGTPQPTAGAESRPVLHRPSRVWSGGVRGEWGEKLQGRAAFQGVPTRRCGPPGTGPAWGKWVRAPRQPTHLPGTTHHQDLAPQLTGSGNW